MEHDGPIASYISAEEDDAKDCLRDNKTPTLPPVHDEFDVDDVTDADVDCAFVFVAVATAEPEDIADDVVAEVDDITV